MLAKQCVCVCVCTVMAHVRSYHAENIHPEPARKPISGARRNYPEFPESVREPKHEKCRDNLCLEACPPARASNKLLRSGLASPSLRTVKETNTAASKFNAQALTKTEGKMTPKFKNNTA